MKPYAPKRWMALKMANCDTALAAAIVAIIGTSAPDECPATKRIASRLLPDARSIATAYAQLIDVV